jgi:hypothetical protein
VQAVDLLASPAGGGDCTNTPCDLQSAIGIAEASGQDNTIHLDSGTYDAHLLSFTYLAANNTSLTLIGEGADQTFLDGGGTNAVMVMDTTALGTDSLADISIERITFQNGFTNSSDGAGLLIKTNSAPVNILQCNFLNNNTNTSNGNGGGLLVETANSGKITLTSNRFDKNQADGGGGGAFLEAVKGDVMVVGNTFTKNVTGGDGGGVVAEVALGTITLVGNTFTGNIGGLSGTSQGGGVFAVGEVGNITVTRNLFSDNLGSAGGGLFAEAELGALLLTDNIFTGNQAPNSSSGPNQGGGGAFLEAFGSPSAVITNNTFTANKAINGDGGGLATVLNLDSDALDLYNNIVFNNLATGSICPGTCNDIFVNDDGDTNLIGSPVNVFNNDYSDISFQCDDSGSPCTEDHHNVDVNTNVIDKDPMFVNAGGGNFSLLTGSPAIDAGTAAAPNLPTTDFAGKLRNQGDAPDMGALESTPPPNPPPPVAENCANNIDDDGDLLIDCNDPDCSGSPACATPTPPGVENCTNGVDDDGDGNIDCNDPDCAGSAACQAAIPTPPGSENCANDVDDDGDGNIDCNDPDCSGSAACQGTGTNSPPTSVSAQGCSMTAGAGSPSSTLFYLLVPLFVAAGRWIRKPQSSRGE